MERLTGVSETLLIPLYAKFLETKREDGIIRDEKSLEIIDRLDLDLDKFDAGFWSTQLGCAVRTEILDRAVSEFLSKYADAVVVNLGGGLCTRFSRLDNGRVRWIEVDLPEVEPVWSQVFQTTDRHQFLAYSVLDSAWVEAIEPFKASPILFIAEGLLMYFSESEVKQLLKTIQTNFPQSQMLFEALSPFMIANYKRHPAVSQTNAVFKWGIKTGRELEAWDSNIQLIEEWYYIDRHPNRWRWMQLFRFIPPLRRSMKIIQLQFV